MVVVVVVVVVVAVVVWTHEVFAEVSLVSDFGWPTSLKMKL